MRKESSGGRGGGGGGGGGEREREREFQFLLVPPHHEFLVVKVLSSDTMIILPVYLQNQEIKYLDLQYLDIFYSNATYVKVFQEK